jgi:VanZ family protein
LERSLLFLALLWTFGVTIGSLASLNNIPAVSISGIDKTAHFIFYFVFFILWYFGLRNKIVSKNFIFILVLITLFYGIGMEVLQANFTTNRQADLYDVLANTIGTFAGFLIGYFSEKTFRNKL